MKLTYALIVAMLFLTACQLITTDDSRGRQEYRAMRARTKMQKSKLHKLTKRCDTPGARCSLIRTRCCSRKCRLQPGGGVCVAKRPAN
uniref:Conotoxin n=1 Tax=Conus praecellens TaxID=128530 RepID=A0A291C2L3_CONPC|nr:conotoxin [Conus praecellens]